MKKCDNAKDTELKFKTKLKVKTKAVRGHILHTWDVLLDMALVYRDLLLASLSSGHWCFWAHNRKPSRLTADLANQISAMRASGTTKAEKIQHYGFRACLFIGVRPYFFTELQCRKRSESSQSAVRSHDLCCRLVATRAPQSSGRHYRMRLHLDWW